MIAGILLGCMDTVMIPFLILGAGGLIGMLGLWQLIFLERLVIHNIFFRSIITTSLILGCFASGTFIVVFIADSCFLSELAFKLALVGLFITMARRIYWLFINTRKSNLLSDQTQKQVL